MTRWEPDAEGRLQQAALDLFAERGYEQTTVADIAARAGLTKRTFFRHFADKREVLFLGNEAFQRSFLEGLASAPAGASPIEAVGAAITGVSAWFDAHRERAYVRRRQAVIVANVSLQERELVKLAAVADAVAEGLRERGVPEPEASIAAQAGIGVFHVAFGRWVAAEADDASLREIVEDSLRTLQAVTAAGRSAPGVR